MINYKNQVGTPAGRPAARPRPYLRPDLINLVWSVASVGGVDGVGGVDINHLTSPHSVDNRIMLATI